MSCKKKIFACVLALAFICIFAKCVYAAEGDVKFSIEPASVSIPVGENKFEFYLKISDETCFASGFAATLEYDSSLIKIDGVDIIGNFQSVGFNSSTGAFAGFRSVDTGAVENVAKIKCTALADDITTVIKLKNFTYSDVDYADYDVPEISVSVAREIVLPTPTPTPSVNDPIQDPGTIVTPTPTPTPTSTPTPTPTPVKDNTISPNKHPQTGANLIIYGVIGAVLFGSVLLFVKYKKQ